jgi:hypothetical protein
MLGGREYIPTGVLERLKEVYRTLHASFSRRPLIHHRSRNDTRDGR